jgi:hypothetical protein
MGGGRTGNFESGINAGSIFGSSGSTPWYQTIVEITAEDTDDDGNPKDGLFKCVRRYYDGQDDTWKNDDGEWHLDVRGLTAASGGEDSGGEPTPETSEGQGDTDYEVGDRLVAWWDRQRQAFVPCGNSGGNQLTMFAFTDKLTWDETYKNAPYAPGKSVIWNDTEKAYQFAKDAEGNDLPAVDLYWAQAPKNSSDEYIQCVEGAANIFVWAKLTPYITDGEGNTDTRWEIVDGLEWDGHVALGGPWTYPDTNEALPEAEAKAYYMASSGGWFFSPNTLKIYNPLAPVLPDGKWIGLPYGGEDDRYVVRRNLSYYYEVTSPRDIFAVFRLNYAWTYPSGTETGSPHALASLFYFNGTGYTRLGPAYPATEVTVYWQGAIVKNDGSWSGLPRGRASGTWGVAKWDVPTGKWEAITVHEGGQVFRGVTSATWNLGTGPVAVQEQYAGVTLHADGWGFPTTTELAAGSSVLLFYLPDEMEFYFLADTNLNTSYLDTSLIVEEGCLQATATTPCVANVIVAGPNTIAAMSGGYPDGTRLDAGTKVLVWHPEAVDALGQPTTPDPQLDCGPYFQSADATQAVLLGTSPLSSHYEVGEVPCTITLQIDGQAYQMTPWGMPKGLLIPQGSKVECFWMIVAKQWYFTTSAGLYVGKGVLNAKYTHSTTAPTPVSVTIEGNMKTANLKGWAYEDKTEVANGAQVQVFFRASGPTGEYFFTGGLSVSPPCLFQLTGGGIVASAGYPPRADGIPLVWHTNAYELVPPAVALWFPTWPMNRTGNYINVGEPGRISNDRMRVWAVQKLDYDGNKLWQVIDTWDHDNLVMLNGEWVLETSGIAHTMGKIGRGSALNESYTWSTEEIYVYMPRTPVDNAGQHFTCPLNPSGQVVHVGRSFVGIYDYQPEELTTLFCLDGEWATLLGDWYSATASLYVVNPGTGGYEKLQRRDNGGTLHDVKVTVVAANRLWYGTDSHPKALPKGGTHVWGFCKWLGPAKDTHWEAISLFHQQQWFRGKIQNLWQRDVDQDTEVNVTLHLPDSSHTLAIQAKGWGYAQGTKVPASTEVWVFFLPDEGKFYFFTPAIDVIQKVKVTADYDSTGGGSPQISVEVREGVTGLATVVGFHGKLKTNNYILVCWSQILNGYLALLPPTEMYEFTSATDPELATSGLQFQKRNIPIPGAGSMIYAEEDGASVPTTECPETSSSSYGVAPSSYADAVGLLSDLWYSGAVGPSTVSTGDGDVQAVAYGFPSTGEVLLPGQEVLLFEVAEDQWVFMTEPYSGTWTMTYKGITSSPLGYNASEADIHLEMQNFCYGSAGPLSSGIPFPKEQGGFLLTFPPTEGQPASLVTVQNYLIGPLPGLIDVTVSYVTPFPPALLIGLMWSSSGYVCINGSAPIYYNDTVEDAAVILSAAFGFEVTGEGMLTHLPTARLNDEYGQFNLVGLTNYYDPGEYAVTDSTLNGGMDMYVTEAATEQEIKITYLEPGSSSMSSSSWSSRSSSSSSISTSSISTSSVSSSSISTSSSSSSSSLSSSSGSLSTSSSSSRSSSSWSSAGLGG